MEALQEPKKKRGMVWGEGKPTYVRFERDLHYVMRAYAKRNNCTIERAIHDLVAEGFGRIPASEQDNLRTDAARLRGGA